MDVATCRLHFGSADVAVLATQGTSRPHLVPIVFAIVGDVITTAVDHKPKRSRKLARLANIERDANVSLLAHHFDEDWNQLWWVRADGTATIHDVTEIDVTPLVARYPPYRKLPPPGPDLDLIERSARSICEGATTDEERVDQAVTYFKQFDYSLDTTDFPGLQDA